MIVRPGNVLYWVACAVALAWLSLWLLATGIAPQPDWSSGWMVGLIGAAVVWIVGRAVKYVLAGMV
jgi:hypothetical protein